MNRAEQRKQWLLKFIRVVFFRHLDWVTCPCQAACVGSHHSPDHREAPLSSSAPVLLKCFLSMATGTLSSEILEAEPALCLCSMRGPEPSSGCGGDVGTGIHGGSYTATACPAMDPACSMLPSAAPVARWASASSLRHNCLWDHAVSCSVKLRCYRTSVSSVFLLTLWPAP